LYEKIVESIVHQCECVEKKKNKRKKDIQTEGDGDRGGVGWGWRQTDMTKRGHQYQVNAQN
jgi:hypothetical protein